MTALIAGAGIGGLVTALSLQRRGIASVVLESARDIRPLGVGLNLQPAAVGVLTELGLGAELAALGIETAAHRYVDRSGRELYTEPRGLAQGNRHPQYSIHRGQLQALLHRTVLDRLGPDAVRTGRRVLDVTQAGRTATATVLERSTGRTERVDAAVLVGADGAGSAVRARLHPNRSRVRWSGALMWRGIASLDGFGDGRTMYLTQDRSGVELVAYPISKRAHDAGRAEVNWVALVPTGQSSTLTENATTSGSGRAADVLPHVAGWHVAGVAVENLVHGASTILTFPMVDRDPLPWWTNGRVTLLGDAAHLMYPVGANGASQAILDGFALADELGATDDVPAALNRYDELRRPATSGVVLANREMDASRSTRVDDPAAIAAVAERYRRATLTG